MIHTGSVYQGWENWLKRFGRYAAAAGCADPTQKRDLFLHSAGPEVQDIFDVLTDTGDTYESAEAKLTEYFKPQQNIPYNRHIFRQERQQEGELIAQFFTRLRQLAISCHFGDKSDDFIHDQVIDKCASKHLRTKLLAEKDLKLTRILELAQAKEASEQHSAEMTE